MDMRRVMLVVRKDIKEFASNRMVVIPMIVVPLVFCVVIPGVIGGLGLGLNQVETLNGVDMLKRVFEFYPIPAGLTSISQQMVYVILNYTFIPMFMIVPLMVASIISANSIVGEKERKTLETLLYSPITNREFIVAKLSSAFIPALVAALVGFVGYFVVGNVVSLALIHQLIIRSWIWLPAMLLLAPGVSLLGLTTTLFVSLKAKTFMEAQQTAGIIVLPIVLLVIVQITGVVIFNVLYLVLFSLLLFAVDYLLISRVLPKFTRESIVSTL